MAKKEKTKINLYTIRYKNSMKPIDWMYYTKFYPEKTKAIKTLRMDTGLRLRDAKEAVDLIFERVESGKVEVRGFNNTHDKKYEMEDRQALKMQTKKTVKLANDVKEMRSKSVKRTYTWAEYYDEFYDWAESTRAKNLTYLTNLGVADEVVEIIIELEDNKNAATRLLRRAVEEKVKFTGEALRELFFCELDENLLLEALRNSAGILTTEDIEEFYITVDDDILLEICKKGNIPIPEDLKEDTEFEEIEETNPEEFEEEIYQQPKKLGLFGTLLAVGLALGSAGKSSPKKKHNGRCDGDCANCPPHYGYRYGRWYYGKGHVRGCEFGGNRCDASCR